MTKTGTIDDAAAVFSALRGDQVIALLSRLETNDAQLLLATAAKLNATAVDLAQASSLLAGELSKDNKSRPNENVMESTDRNPRPHGDVNHEATCSLDFLIELPDKDIRVLLSKVSTACWAPALKSEPNAVREIIFSNVAPSIERILNYEIAAFDGNATVVQESREKITAAANDLQRLATLTTEKKAA